MSVVTVESCTDHVVSGYRANVEVFPDISDTVAIHASIEYAGDGLLDARRLAAVVVARRESQGDRVDDCQQVYEYVCYLLREAEYCCRHQVDDGMYRVHGGVARCGAGCDVNRGRAPKARVYDYGVCQDCCLTLPASGVCSWCND